MITKKNSLTLKMKTLSERANEAYEQGYTENFKIVDRKLTTADEKITYQPMDVKIVNTYRFDNYSNSEDTAILYLIETHNGIRGTLIDAHGIYADGIISNFVREVTGTHKNQ